MTAVIGIHPERVAGDGRVVRWVVPTGGLPAGRVTRAPGRLGEMLCDGTLSDALAEHGAVWLWLREDLSWATTGAVVQAALRDALADPCGWIVQPAPGEVLAHVIADLLAGSLGDFVRSHGGSVTAQRCGEDVTVQLGGACEHCPAAGYTLRQRLIGGLRQRCPELVERDLHGGRLRLTLAPASD